MIIGSGGFAASGLKIKNLDFSSVKPKLRILQSLHGLRTPTIVRFDGLVLSQRSKKKIIACRSSDSKADCELILCESFQLHWH